MIMKIDQNESSSLFVLSQKEKEVSVSCNEFKDDWAKSMEKLKREKNLVHVKKTRNLSWLLCRALISRVRKDPKQGILWYEFMDIIGSFF